MDFKQGTRVIEPANSMDYEEAIEAGTKIGDRSRVYPFEVREESRFEKGLYFNALWGGFAGVQGGSRVYRFLTQSE